MAQRKKFTRNEYPYYTIRYTVKTKDGRTYSSDKFIRPLFSTSVTDVLITVCMELKISPSDVECHQITTELCEAGVDDIGLKPYIAPKQLKLF